jgi:hypothetical protein
MFDRRAKSAFIVACIVLIACGLSFEWAVGHLNYYLRKEPIDMRASFSTIPDVIGEWRKAADDRILDKAMVEELGTDKYLNRLYAIEGQRTVPRLDLHLAYYTGMIDAIPHVPDRCMVAAGFNAKSLPENVPLTIDTSTWTVDPVHVNRWTGQPYPMVEFRHHFTGQQISARMPVGDIELRITEFESEDSPEIRVFAGYLFIANGRTTPTPDSVRLLAFAPSERHAYYCKVQFNMVGPASFTRQQFVDAVSAFFKDFLPDLMRCLPDWAEVEASDQPAPATDPASVQAR